jgi:hypothetical protein
MGLIDTYDNTVHPEPLIYIYHLLVHADDTLLMATTRDLAMKKITTLLQYCTNNFIKLQITKCSFMCVNSNDVDDSNPFEIQNLLLNPTTSEAYLGSIITNSTKMIDDVKADIKNRQLSIVKFFSFLRCNRNAPVYVKKKVLEACSLSSLLYNAETWADAKFTQLEVSYRRMLKAILGVGMKTINEIVYIELGVLSIKTLVTIKQWKFWTKVMEMSEDNPLIHIIKEAKRLKLKEIKHYEKLIESYENVDEIIDEFYGGLRDSIRQKAASGRSKYITYLEVNPSLETPKIYDEIQKHHLVSMIGKLRTSSHNLQVEMGRRTRKAREERICLCGRSVEDERHFLTECGLYDEIRRKYFVVDVDVATVLNDVDLVGYVLELFERRKAMT